MAKLLSSPAAHLSLQCSAECPNEIVSVRCFGTVPQQSSFNTPSTSLRSKKLFEDASGRISKAPCRRSVVPVSAVSSTEAYTSVSSKKYEKIGECLVYSPPKLGANANPKAIIYFLGGAFIGATPDVTYSLLIESLAEAGYLVVATPYNVTFDHEGSTRTIHQRFITCLTFMEANGVRSAGITGAQVEKLPVYGVGHSNGALMHALIGCLGEDEARNCLPSANVLISYNNRPAVDAVPFFDQLGPALTRAAPAIEAFPLTGIALSLAEQVLQELDRNPIPLPRGVDPDVLEPLSRFGNQILPVFGQVRDGVSEFTPTPSENRRNIVSSYSVPRTLLIKFTTDSIDETDALKSILEIRASQQEGGQVETKILTGTHATPLAPDLKWRVGSVYTPIDAVRQTLRTAALSDLRTLASTIVDWLDDLTPQAA
eukprot:TRINITY_DN2991_c0_g1_i1.p1 TRINITY_DN2991_c0_g1~~TRINITY_DN2991_c0_g1_i1.p1  ORF type:complete len:436 (+),score=47.30 TRINITY_DN2991_c0_g1_i1:26-1309(+)